MKLLVTGGCGFIGSAFVRRTLHNYPDDEVVVLDKLAYAGNLANLDSVKDSSKLKIVRGDICDEELTRQLAAETDVIVNFAAASHVDKSLTAAHEFLSTNINGVYSLLEAAKSQGHTRFVQISTDEVYGDVKEGFVDEEAPFRPRSPYSASKAAGELLVQSYRASFDFPAIVTRGSNTYGPYQYPEKIIPLFATNALMNLPLPVYGDGLAVRDYLHVDDHCAAIDLVLRAGIVGEDYNIGFGHEKNALEVASNILSLLELPQDSIEKVQDRRGHDRRYAVNSSKLHMLGWRPQIEFSEGLATTVEWYKENRSWWEPLKDKSFWEYYSKNYKAALPQAD